METLTLADATAIVPAIDEERSIGEVVRGLLERGVGRVIVADGGSGDGTAALAAAAGAHVIIEPRRGYGRACLSGVAAAGEAPILLFLDGDGAEDLDGAARVVQALLDQHADLALGVRVVAPGEDGAQTSLARAGNRFCSWWLRGAFGAEITDLPSMKAIRRELYEQLHPEDPLYGWTAQLLARAARRRLRIVELPVSYRRRTGRSKVSGTARGALRAGSQMLVAIGRESAGACADALTARLSRFAGRKALAQGGRQG